MTSTNLLACSIQWKVTFSHQVDKSKSGWWHTASCVNSQLGRFTRQIQLRLPSTEIRLAAFFMKKALLNMWIRKSERVVLIFIALLECYFLHYVLKNLRCDNKMKVHLDNATVDISKGVRCLVILHYPFYQKQVSTWSFHKALHLFTAIWIQREIMSRFCA